MGSSSLWKVMRNGRLVADVYSKGYMNAVRRTFG
jgi:hypothetical protein